ncbi:MAG: UbiX family flavin prenyltransferase [Cellulosilyticaceae bacterium]
MKKVVVGITGASGSIYAKRLIEELLKAGIQTRVIATQTGEKVFAYELEQNLRVWIEELQNQYNDVALEEIDNLFAGVASGSHAFDAVIIVPCSMGTLAEIAHGLSRNLMTRAADVALKERRRLVIVPRETPFNTIHLENMLMLSKAGASILPAMPGFYHKPESLDQAIDFVIGKVLDHLSIENNLFKKWEN